MTTIRKAHRPPPVSLERTTGPAAEPSVAEPPARGWVAGAGEAARAVRPEAVEPKPRADAAAPATVAIMPPAMMNDQVADKGNFVLGKVSGPLFRDAGPTMGDVNQGLAGDCYLLSSLVSIVNTNPDAIKKLISKNDDGTYTVHFKKPDGAGGFKDAPVKVDDRLYARVVKDEEGNALGFRAAYATSKPRDHYQDGADPDARTEDALWAGLVEKAWAQMNGGSFEEIGNGGYPKDVMQAVLGKNANSFTTASMSDGELWANLKAAADSGAPTVSSTHCDAASVPSFTNTGLVHGHAYAVLGVSERDGEKFVKLRNPWGHGEFGKDAVDDGIFEMKLADYRKYFDWVSVAPTKVQVPIPPKAGASPFGALAG